MMMQFIKKQWKWLQKKIKPMPSTEMKKGALPSLQQNSHPDIRSSASLHRSCKTLSLSAFIAAYCNDDLSGLIISGNPSPSQLKEAWEDIYINYCCRIKYSQSDTLLELGKQIGALDCHVLYVQNAVFYLNYRYDEEVMNELRLLGYDINYEIDDIEERNRQLNRIISLLKTTIFDLQSLKDQYDSLSKMSSSKKQTEEDFLSIIFSVSKYQGYAINKKKTVLEDFIVMYNNFLAYLENLQKQYKHG